MRPFRFWSVIVSLFLVFTIVSCNQQIVLKDTKPPVIVVFSPADNSGYYLYADISIQVNEQYEGGRESGLRDIGMEVSQGSSSYVLFRTNINVSGNEYRFSHRLYVDTNAFSSYILRIFASDGSGNNASRVVRFYSSPYGNFYISLNNSFYATNTNVLGFHGSINIPVREIYGNVSNVVLIVSNSFGSFTNNVSYFDDTYWYLNPTTLNLEEASTTSRSNLLEVLLTTTSNSNTSYTFSFYYDTNRPYVAITNLTNGQIVPRLVSVVVSNFDNLGLSEGRLYMISGGVTNVTNNYILLGNTRVYNVLIGGVNTTFIPYERDVAGNEYYGAPVSVIYDASLVSISMNSPLSDFSIMSTNRQVLVFQGQAYVGEEYEVTNVVLMVYTNGSLVSATSRVYNASTVNWTITNNVFMGTNEIRYFALSDSGKSSPTNYVTLVVDYIKPVVRIISPTNNSEFDVDVIQVVSYVDDTNFSLGVWGNIYVNGVLSGHISAAGTNTNTVNLARGSNSITIVVQDAMYNFETNITVVRYLDDAVYVSILGNDANSGSRVKPLRSIQKGIERAVQLGLSNIYVSAGVYTPGNGLNNSNIGVVITNNGLNIVGGWDNNFNSIIGYSELDGMNNLYHVVYASNVSGVSLSNFVVRNGRVYSYPFGVGGGLYLYRFNYGILSNLIVTNNYSSSGGGGICLWYSTNNIIYGEVNNNISGYMGGGIYLGNSSGNVINGNVNNNISGGSGGGVYLYNSSSNRVFANVYSNIATNVGGGIGLSGSIGNVISSAIYQNTVVSSSFGYGGGIILDNSHSNVITNSRVFSNYSDYIGGGICLWYSTNNIIYGEVNNNISVYGGGIYLGSSSGNKVFASVYSNVSTNDGGGSSGAGGGIYLANSSGNVINGNVNNNISRGVGGGILLSGSSSNKVFANVYSNVTTYGGGGVSMFSSSGNVISSAIYQNASVSSAGYGGGGIFLYYSHSNVITNSRVFSNYSASSGGGIDLYHSGDNIIYGEVNNNISGYIGGGIYLSGSFRNVIFANTYSNVATNGGGGVVFNQSTNNFISSKIYQNISMTGGTSYGGGGGILVKSSSGNIVSNSDIYQNLGGGVYFSYSSSNSLLGSRIYQNYT
ncbi:MAG: right-handed parallel beta-helix repeat-containing protein, partial [Spirochaetes bacterium]|nr:right-handed parallel beta-helix repeat-containing protein [Spirochaetota bacterium]